MSTDPTKPVNPLEARTDNAADHFDACSDMKALEHQAELKRLIKETCESISSSQDLIQQIKTDRGI